MVRRVDDKPMMPSTPNFVHPSHRPFAPREHWSGPTDYGKRTSAEIIAKLRAFGKRKPNREWAHRLMDRHYDGEHFPIIALEMARAVATVPAAETQPSRIPGEDDE